MAVGDICTGVESFSLRVGEYVMKGMRFDLNTAIRAKSMVVSRSN